MQNTILPVFLLVFRLASFPDNSCCCVCFIRRILLFALAFCAENEYGCCIVCIQYYLKSCTYAIIRSCPVVNVVCCEGPLRSIQLLTHADSCSTYFCKLHWKLPSLVILNASLSMLACLPTRRSFTKVNQQALFALHTSSKALSQPE